MPTPSITALIQHCQSSWAKAGDVMLLLRSREAYEAIDAGDERGRTALHWAVHHTNAPLVKILLDMGAHPDQPDLDGNTPLNLVAWYGNARSQVAHNTVDALMDHMADPHRPNRRGDTPMSLAQRLGSTTMMIRMRAPRDLEIRMSGFVTHAMPGRRTYQVTRCLALGVDPNGRVKETRQPWLHAAAAHRDSTVMKLLLDHGADPNLLDAQHQQALHQASPFPGPLMKILIDAGSAVDPVDREGRSPLWMAVNRDNPDGVQFLLDQGADPDRADLTGESPWTLAHHRNGVDPIYNGERMIGQVLSPARIARERALLASQVPAVDPLPSTVRKRL